MGLTETEIGELLRELKPLPRDYMNKMVAKPKSDRKFVETELKVTGSQGHKFILTVNRNTINPEAFSVILHYIEESTNKDILLIRCNGKHRHYNKLEGQWVNGYHVHIATERYLALDNNNPGFAYETDEYSNWSGALAIMIKNYGFRVGHQRPLEHYFGVKK